GERGLVDRHWAATGAGGAGPGAGPLLHLGAGRAGNGGGVRGRARVTLRRRRCVLTLPLGVAACVAYDIAGPPVPSVDGTYATIIAVSYANTLELRSDTLPASITLHDTHFRGNFDGTYRTAFGDTGRFAGTERPEGTLVVTDFDAPPKPIAYVFGLRHLYPWCDFLQLVAGP